MVYNEGNITPQKYAQTITALRNLATIRGFTVPLLVGYEDYGLNKSNWMKSLINNGWGILWIFMALIIILSGAQKTSCF